MEVDFASAQYDEDVTCVVLRIIEPETNHSRLPIFLLQSLKLKSLGIGNVCLRVVGYSLLVRHCFVFPGGAAGWGG